MVHLPVHLAEEASLGGPVCYRWMYPVERYLCTLKGYVMNKAHHEGSVAEGYITEECMTFCSQFFEDVLTRPERHESAAVSEPPSGLSVFGSLDYSRKGFSMEKLKDTEMRTMRHYILTNCDEFATLADEHKDLLKKYDPHNVERRHKEQFVRWFEDKTKKYYDQGKANELMYALSEGPDPCARVFNRCVINGFLFRTVPAESNLITQNSGVLVKGDESTGNMDWYGVIKKIISREFPGGKELMMFQCDWYDVPAPTQNKSRGYKKDQYGIIDIDTTHFRYSNDPYILVTQAEQVFYVKDAKKSDWSSVVRMKPRNIFSMPESYSNETKKPFLHARISKC
ncbi:uncharacterized protein [Miscanthus floridulus]|uniref:uncharacterized protein n=1 Tax=Miscanthus floridulus TaxID=154761 RepID=UPI00345A4D38